jgi:hypothetical protein
MTNYQPNTAGRIMNILKAASVPPEPAAAIAADAIATGGRKRLAGIATAWTSRGPVDEHGAWWDAWQFVAKVAKRHGFDVPNLATVDSVVLEITVALNVVGVGWADAEAVAIDAVATYGPDAFAIITTGWGDTEGQAAWMRAWHRVAEVAARHGWPVSTVDLVAW